MHTHLRIKTYQGDSKNAKETPGHMDKIMLKNLNKYF